MIVFQDFAASPGLAEQFWLTGTLIHASSLPIELTGEKGRYIVYEPAVRVCFLLSGAYMSYFLANFELAYLKVLI